MGSRPALSVVFLSTGVVFGTWVARLPAVKVELGLSDAGLSVALLALEGGALLGLPLGGRFVARHGSTATLRWALPLFAMALTGLASRRRFSCSPSAPRSSPPSTASSTSP